MKFEISNT